MTEEPREYFRHRIKMEMTKEEARMEQEKLTNGRVRACPASFLQKKGLWSVDGLINEFKLIKDKKSKLSPENRRWVHHICMKCFLSTIKKRVVNGNKSKEDETNKQSS